MCKGKQHLRREHVSWQKKKKKEFILWNTFHHSFKMHFHVSFRSLWVQYCCAIYCKSLHGSSTQWVPVKLKLGSAVSGLKANMICIFHHLKLFPTYICQHVCHHISIFDHKGTFFFSGPDPQLSKSLSSQYWQVLTFEVPLLEHLFDQQRWNPTPCTWCYSSGTFQLF